MNAIETHRLGKRYGPNGAGKTTLLQLAVGLIGLTTGDIGCSTASAPGSSQALDSIVFLSRTPRCTST